MIEKLLLHLCYTVIQLSFKGFPKWLGGESPPPLNIYCLANNRTYISYSCLTFPGLDYFFHLAMYTRCTKIWYNIKFIQTFFVSLSFALIASTVNSFLVLTFTFDLCLSLDDSFVWKRIRFFSQWQVQVNRRHWKSYQNFLRYCFIIFLWNSSSKSEHSLNWMWK